MAQDRLNDLQNGGSEVMLNQIEMEDKGLQMEDVFGEFQSKSDSMKTLLQRLKQNGDNMQDLKQKYNKATTVMVEKEISIDLDRLINQNSTIIKDIDKNMKQMKQIVDQDCVDFPNEPETRMKNQMLQALVQKTSQVIEQTREQQDSFKQTLKNKVSRQVKHLDDNLNQDQIDQLCDNPEQAQLLLQEKMYGKASIQLQNAVTDIKDKFKDIMKLEKSVEQVYQLFQDMAILTYQQGKQVDKIEGFLNQAHNYVNKGEKQQINAKKDQKASQKKMCCIFLILTIILLVILAPILSAA